MSECEQEITFSSECGFTLETPSASPSPTLDRREDGDGNGDGNAMITPAPLPTIKTLMTYYLAPWQSLTAGSMPSDVDIKVCALLPDDTPLDEESSMECTRFSEVWEVVTVTRTFTTEREVLLSTTVVGPGVMFIESLRAEIADTLVLLDLSTRVGLEMSVETETVSRSRNAKEVEGKTEEKSTSTQYVTKEVKYAQGYMR